MMNDDQLNRLMFGLLCKAVYVIGAYWTYTHGYIFFSGMFTAMAIIPDSIMLITIAVALWIDKKPIKSCMDWVKRKWYAKKYFIG